MYIPSAFAEDRVDVLQQFMRDNPFATLVVQTADGMEANHIPLQLKLDGSDYGMLVGHVARSNSLWRLFSADVQVLVIFTGTDAYISPSWYPTKQEHGKVVPTWNYTAVHASGFMRIIEDKNWLLSLLNSQTAEHEAQFVQPWALADAPAEFIEKLLGAIVGIEIPISTLRGKWKLSQNQPEDNRQGVASGLEALESPIHCAMAAMVKAASMVETAAAKP